MTIYCKVFWQNQFNVVKQTLKDKFDYDVICMTGEIDRADFQDRIIYINSRCHPETRFYTLLHEYGHVELHEGDNDELRAAVPCYQSFYKNRWNRSKSGKVATIVEELEAWKRGRLLALREDWIVDIEKYEKNMNDALMSYIKWAAGHRA
jgi:hypothetical protein